MKNVLKTLNTQKEEVELKFSQAEQRRQSIIQASQKLQTEMNELMSEMARLQGEHRRLTQLLDDFKDEPKNKE